MNTLIKKYYSLCLPAKVYLLVSLLSFMAMLYQNILTQHKYKIGNFSVDLDHSNYLLFIVKIIYITIWTFLLNELCRHGWKSISWFLVIGEILLMFIFIGILILANT